MNNLFPLILAGADPSQIESLQRAEREGTIFNCSSLAPVNDAEGDPLIKDQVYVKPNGKLFRVTRWEFGAGNCLDSFYRVYGIDDRLQDHRITVDVQHRHRQASHYPSKLQKSFHLEQIQDEHIRQEILRRRVFNEQENTTP